MTTTQSPSVTALAVALAKAQAAIAPAVKDKTNPAFKSRYADLPSVWDACRKPLTDNGLSIVQMPVDAAEPGRVALTTILLHSSGEYISSTVSTRLNKDDAQGIGSALTYLRRYALSAVVGVVADEDDDGNAASRPQAREAQYQPPVKTVPVPPRQNNTDTNNGADAAEARRKFYERWSTPAGTTWPMVAAFLGIDKPEPSTVDGWREVWRLTKLAADALEAEAALAAEYDAIEAAS